MQIGKVAFSVRIVPVKSADSVPCKGYKNPVGGFDVFVTNFAIRFCWRKKIPNRWWFNFFWMEVWCSWSTWLLFEHFACCEVDLYSSWQHFQPVLAGAFLKKDNPLILGSLKNLFPWPQVGSKLVIDRTNDFRFGRTNFGFVRFLFRLPRRRNERLQSVCCSLLLLTRSP